MKQGLCNRSGQLGRNLTLHPSTGLSGLYDELIDGTHHIPQGYGTQQFIDEGILIKAANADPTVYPIILALTGKPLMKGVAQQDHMVGLGILAHDHGEGGRVWWSAKGHPLITYNLTPADVHCLHQGLVRGTQMLVAAGARKVYPGMMNMPVLEGPADFQRLIDARPKAGDFILISYHPLGTAKMGRDPRTSVVDLYQESHDVKNLHLIDGARLRQTLLPNAEVEDDGSMHDVPLPDALAAPARRWLIRNAPPSAPTELADWMRRKGAAATLADVASRAEASFGGLYSVDRIHRYGGMQMVASYEAPGSVVQTPLVACPAGAGLVIAARDIDAADARVALAIDGSLWRYDFGWDRWVASAARVDVFVARLALWPHPELATTHVARERELEAILEELHLDVVPEASDAHGTLHWGDEAALFERVLPEARVVHARALTTTAEHLIQEWIRH
jgi:hypothetical protein